MVDVERLARLLRRVSDDVRRLRQHAGDDPASLLADEVLLDHVKYRFVTAIEAVIDVAHHVGATEGFAAPATNADAVRALAADDLITPADAAELARAVGFRNLLVHRYAEVIDEKVVAQLQQLDALDRFVAGLTRRYL